MESQTSLGWKEPVKAILSNPPTVSRDIFNQIRLLGVPSNLTWNVCRDGASTTSLGNLCQGFTTLIVKKLFLISSLNLPFFILKPLPLVLSLQTMVNYHYRP